MHKKIWKTFSVNVEKVDKTQGDVSEAISSLESAEAEFNKVYQYRALHFENFEETDHNGFQSYLEFGTEITDATTNKNVKNRGKLNRKQREYDHT